MEMIGYRYDDGGRAVAGRKGHTGDCTVRALAILTGEDYERCYRALADAEKRHGNRKMRSASRGVHKRAYTKVYREFGLTPVQLPPGPRPTYSEAHRLYGDCIVSTAKHLCAIVAGELRDTHDGRTYDARLYGGGECAERKAQTVWIVEGFQRPGALRGS